MRPIRLAAALLALLLLPAFGGAQEETSAQEPVVSAPAELATPRRTLTTFFRAFRLAREGASGDPITEAVTTLDLSALPTAVRDAKGRELAVLLKDVLDKTRRIEVDRVPDEPDGAPYVVISQSQGDVVLSRHDDGGWRFTAATLDRLPRMAEALADADVVQGVEAAARSISPAVWTRSRLPSQLKKTTFLLENWQWLGLLILIVLGLIVDRLAAAVAARVWRVVFGRWSPKSLDRELAHSTARPIGIVAMAVLWRFGLPWLGLPAEPLRVLGVAITFLVAAGFVWATYRAVDLVGAYFEDRAAESVSKSDDLLVPLIRKSLKVFIAAFGLVFVADNLDVNVTGLVAGIGIGGLALALAAQDAVKNLFGSVMVILDRPFEVDDWVVINGIEGSVTELGFRSTRIRTPDDTLVTLPNANLISSPVDNFGKRNFRRWKMHLGLTYDTPAEKVEAFCEGVRQLIRDQPGTRKDAFYVHFNQFGPASLDVLVVVYFATKEWGVELAGKHRLGIDVLRLAERLGVEFAFPTQTIHVVHGGAEEEVGVAGEDYARRLAAAETAARQAAEGLRLSEARSGD